jgi:hypothetical protein
LCSKAAGCATCKNADSCETCINDHTLLDDDSKPTPKKTCCLASINCKTCAFGAPNKCLSCNDGFYMNGNVCSPCNSKQCKTCKDSKSCLTCAANY